jgi:hypothetical protein
MTDRATYFRNKRLCKCGCGNIRKVGKKFISGHNNRGLRGEKTSQWKGDNISYSGLHVWLGRHRIKPAACENCGKISKLDFACITGIYNRDSSNWKYLCRSCHMISDGVNRWRLQKRIFSTFINQW